MPPAFAGGIFRNWSAVNSKQTLPCEGLSRNAGDGVPYVLSRWLGSAVKKHPKDRSLRGVIVH